jgi:taurine dioxygenase
VAGTLASYRQAAPSIAAVHAGAWQGRRLSPSIGLELSGISLADPFDAQEIVRLRSLLVEHKVLVFRGQAISPAQHVAFARRFGQLEVHPMLSRHPEQPELVTFVHDGANIGGENRFHSDTSFYATPSMASILRCIECPESGGDTLFVNMGAAYRGLPDSIKERIRGLYAVHDAAPVFGQSAKSTSDRNALRAKHPAVEHPVVRAHPESGEEILYVNEAFTTHFANFRHVHQERWLLDGPAHARDLLDLLLRQARIPEYQVRIQWRSDTVVFWDNRATQHYAISDYFPNLRSMARATVIGEAPRAAAGNH